MPAHFAFQRILLSHPSIVYADGGGPFRVRHIDRRDGAGRISDERMIHPVEVSSNQVPVPVDADRHGLRSRRIKFREITRWVANETRDTESRVEIISRDRAICINSNRRRALIIRTRGVKRARRSVKMNKVA